MAEEKESKWTTTEEWATEREEKYKEVTEKYKDKKWPELTTEEKYEIFEARKAVLERMGGLRGIKRQHERGKYTVRERVDLLFDPGTFVEIGLHCKSSCLHYDMYKVPVEDIPADGILAGYGLIEGRPVYAFFQDFTCWGGTLGRTHADKIKRVAGEAVQNGCPMLYIADSGGARIQEGTDSLAGYGDLFYTNSIYSGCVPQLCAIIGPCAGGAVYSPALMDCIFTVDRETEMFITGPIVIKAILGEEVGKEELGGARVNSERSGNGTFFAKDEDESIWQIKKLLSFLPGSSKEKPPYVETGDPADRTTPELRKIIPDSLTEPYDMKKVIEAVVDNGDFFEWAELFAPNLICAFARMNGNSVGIIAQNPMHLNGDLDMNAGDKGSRFMRFCDAYNIPLISFVDASGYAAGKDQEVEGIIRHTAKLIQAYAEATVPKVTVITRKAFGGPALLGSKSLGSDLVLAWPTCEMTAVSPESAVGIIGGDELDYRSHFSDPAVPAARLYIDEIIDAADTRSLICKALKMFENKDLDLPYKKHNVKPH
jgi:acetyl-CoA carboxylase carboxyltransferase component